jgi:23S rRNA pseudouridine2457 synthase
MNKLWYFKVYKPYNMLSQFTDVSGRPTLKELYNFPGDVYSAGRLDSDSEGLLLLTNDKRLNHLLFSPKAHVEKEYLVQVEGIPSEEAIQKLRNGVQIEKKLTLPAKAEIINPPTLPERNPPVRFRKTVPDTWLKIIISEGRNRQIRKMTASIGHPTLRIVRIRIKKLTLANMNPGEVTELSLEEVKNLLNEKS